MGQTLAEKILAQHVIEGKPEAGEFIEAEIDLLMVHEVLGSRIMPILNEMNFERVWDPQKVLVVNDHWAPAKDAQTAEIHRRNREFVRVQGIQHFCDVECGICHQVLPEMGLVKPGDLVVGADSHSTTYGAFNAFSTGLAATDSAIILATGQCWFKVPESLKIEIEGRLPERVMSKDLILKLIADLGPDGANYQSMEFHGTTIDRMSVDSRMVMCNMSVEAGAKCAPMNVNDSVKQWMKRNAPDSTWTETTPDVDAEYIEKIAINLETEPLEPMVAVPHSPANSKIVQEVEGTHFDQAFIGSCTNGRVEDLAIAAEILRNRRIDKNVRMIVTPASRSTYLQALELGYIQILAQAGAIITNSTCGACIGGHLGVLGKDEVCISSTNRNFKGRMGSPSSQVYLASPATVAASAYKGVIADPREV